VNHNAQVQQFSSGDVRAYILFLSRNIRLCRTARVGIDLEMAIGGLKLALSRQAQTCEGQMNVEQMQAHILAL
jgi:hypothetical protein